MIFDHPPSVTIQFSSGLIMYSQRFFTVDYCFIHSNLRLGGGSNEGSYEVASQTR